MTVDDPSVRQRMLEAREVARVLTTIGLALMSALLAIETFNIIEKRHKLYNNRMTRNTVTTLYGSSIFGVACIAGICASWWSDWTGKEIACSVYIKLVSIIFYLIMKQFIYMLLFVRMKLVHDAFNINGFYMRMVRWAVFLNVVLGVPIVFYPLAVIFFDGYVTLDGICVQYSTNRYPLVFFTLGDVTLSMCMLLLFIAPLTRHSRKVHETKTVVMRIAHQ